MPSLSLLADVIRCSNGGTLMADQPRKDQTKDLPPRKDTKSDEDKVKGGAQKVSKPLPFDPSNG